MPSLKYYDPASSSYKYLVGGLTQDSADARYLTSVPSGFRNVIRNGDMSISQRGVGPFTTGAAGANGYTLDGWWPYSNRAGCTVTQVSLPVGQQAAEFGMEFVTVSQTLQTDFASVAMYQEDCYTLQGQVATISFMAKVNSATAKIAVMFQQYLGNASGTGDTNTIAGSVTVDTTLRRYSVTFTVPSLSGKTINGVTPTDSYDVCFVLSAGTNSGAYTATGVGLQNNKTFTITDVQVEAGPVATPFERLPLQQQLAWCQRYFQRKLCTGPANNSPVAVGTNYAAATETYAVMHLPVLMRANPTITFSSATAFSLYAGGSAKTTSNMIPGGVNPDAVEIVAQTATATGATGQGSWIRGNQNAYIDLSADL